MLSQARKLQRHLEAVAPKERSDPQPATPPRYRSWNVGKGRGSVMRDISFPPSISMYLHVR